MQEGRPVAFSSRAMTKTEQRYAQIEKEMLAIVHACTKFDQYIYGRQGVRVESDHKPLESIFKKNINSSPKRLQRMLMYLQKYDLKVEYKRGKEMYIADTLSRAYLNHIPKKQDVKCDILAVKELEICALVESLTMTGDTPNSKKRMEEIRKGTTEDEALHQVINFIQNGWPDENNALPGAVKPYFSVRNELTVDDGLIWKGDRCVIPMTMRKKSMQLIHSSHIGIESCLRRAREYVYWPGMNHEIKDFISKCDVCNRLRSSQMREPLESHDIPSRAWSTLSADLFQFKGQQYLIVVDHYSNYFEARK
jgi:hypothetical protein